MPFGIDLPYWVEDPAVDLDFHIRDMTVMSYRHRVDFGIITDRDQIDDAWALMDGTAAALDELETANCGKRTTTLV